MTVRFDMATWRATVGGNPLGQSFQDGTYICSELSDSSGDYYPAAEVEAYRRKVRALVEAIRSEHLTAKYILAEMRGHGYALYDQLEKKLKRTEAALAALEAEDD